MSPPAFLNHGRCLAAGQRRWTTTITGVIAHCFVAGEDVAGALVDQGLAWAFVRYSDVYVALEAVARATGIEVWQAETTPAWDYRAERWTKSAAAAPAEGCPIKGNINAEGERI